MPLLCVCHCAHLVACMWVGGRVHTRISVMVLIPVFTLCVTARLVACMCACLCVWLHVTCVIACLCACVRDKVTAMLFMKSKLCIYI